MLRPVVAARRWPCDVHGSWYSSGHSGPEKLHHAPRRSSRSYAGGVRNGREVVRRACLQWREQWSEQEWFTLRLGPVWVLSALVGRVRFDDDERGAFWDAVTDAALRSTGPGRDLLGTAAAERRWLFDEFELDGRPVVSGTALCHTAARTHGSRHARPTSARASCVSV